MKNAHITSLMFLCAALLSACGGGGATSTPPITSPTPTPTPSPIPGSVQVVLSQSGQTVSLPSTGGLSGSVTVPANNAAAGTTMQVTLINGIPAGGPVPAAIVRMSSTKTVLFSLEVQVSQTVTFNGFPGFTLTLPSTMPTSGQSFFIAAYQGTSSSAPLLTTIGPASVSGQTLTFPPTATPLTLQAGTTYLLELYETASATASPSPSASPSSSPSPAAGTAFVFYAGASDSVASFAANASGSATALSSFTFSGNFGTGIAVDATGRVYVANTSNILSFAYGASGSATPSTTLTTNAASWGLAVDPSGDLVTTDFRNNVVDYFAPGATAGAAPVKQITGSNTQINYPYQAAFDGSGNLYVLNASASPSITKYSAASITGTGTINATPIAVITSATSNIDGPEGLAVDSTGRIYVGNSQNNTITVFASGSNGNTAPVATLSGSLGFSINQATIAVDPSTNDLYVAGGNNSSVYVFAPVTSSSQTPIRTFTYGTAAAEGIGIVP